MAEIPNPGSLEAQEMGCTCPVMDNGQGKGYMGGAKDKDGNTMFVMSVKCPIHGKVAAKQMVFGGMS